MRLKPHDSVTDEYGNKIVRSHDILSLSLSSENRVRRLGIIDRSSKTLNIKRNRKKHLHKKSNSYGFNYFVISTAKTFDKLLINDEFGNYLISLDQIKKHGQFLFFKQQGFEKQIFISLDVLNEHKVTF